MSAEFADAMRAAGLEPPAAIDPDRLYRFPGIGKQRGNTSGWCKLFADGRGGVFGDWSTDFSEHRQAKREKTFSRAERAAFKRQIAESRAQAEADREASQADAATKATAVWEVATPATDNHPYLVAKGVQAHDLRVHDGRLLVPLRDAGGNLQSVQFIDPDGAKRYIRGGAVHGNHWTIGVLTSETPYLYIAEGAATAAALYGSTGGCTVAAMSAGNLKPVAEALHAAYPGARIIICADDDSATDGNPGMKAATEAAHAVGGIIAVPQFPEPRDPASTDWCDLALLSGLKAVKAQIDDLLAAVDTFETPPPQTTPSTSAEDGRIIAELAALPPLDYDRRRADTAKKLGVRATTLDKLVSEKREKMLAGADEDGAVVEDLAAWLSPVDGRELANQIARMIGDHVALPPGACTVVTLWSIGSFCMDAWRIWPKLLITSPEKRCGKSTLLEALEGICYRSLLTSGITASSLFRCIEEWQPSLLIDEADCFAKDNDELNGIINAGHTKRTATVIRSEKVGDSFKPKKFSVWCPQVISGIKSQRDTLHDRSIHIQMRRKLPGESVLKIPFDYYDQHLTIRRQCLRWAADNIDRLRMASPTVPNYGNDRAQDNWSPLLAIADLVGAQWPEKAASAYNVMTTGHDDDDTIGPMILSDIREVFGNKASGVIHSDDLVSALVDMEERPWCEWKHGKPLTKNSLARLLKPYLVKSRQIKIGTINRHGYRKQDFQDAFDRYLSPVAPIQNATSLQASDSKGFSDIQNATREGEVAFQNRLKASDSAGCSKVAFQNGDIRDEGMVDRYFEEFSL